MGLWPVSKQMLVGSEGGDPSDPVSVNTASVCLRDFSLEMAGIDGGRGDSRRIWLGISGQMINFFVI